MAVEAEQRTTLSDYQCDCANPNAVKTPQTYKQGKVVRLDQDVREVQKWTGTNPDGKGAASMNRETRTALRDKVAEYQKQNGIQAQVPGELNKDTLDKMRQDKTLPQGLTDSLEKVKPYYKPEGIARMTCVTPPANGAASPEPVKVAPGLETPKALSPLQLDKLGFIGGDRSPADEAKLQASIFKKQMETIQQKAGIPQSGCLDAKTTEALKSNPALKEAAPLVDKWKQNGLIDKDGNWDQKRQAEMRVESWKVKVPEVNQRPTMENDPRRLDAPATKPAAAPQQGSGIGNIVINPDGTEKRSADGKFIVVNQGPDGKWAQYKDGKPVPGTAFEGQFDYKRNVVVPDAQPLQKPVEAKPANPLAGKTFEGGGGTTMNVPYKYGVDSPGKIMNVPADLSNPDKFQLKLTGADQSMPEGKLAFNGSAQPSFLAAREHAGPQSLEVMARTPVPVAAPELEKQSFQQRSGISFN